MINVDKQVAFWRDGAEVELLAADALIAKQLFRQGLFFAHLALEKMLKANVVRCTKEIPPYTHNLKMLWEKTGLPLAQDQAKFLKRFTEYQLIGRYPDSPKENITLKKAQKEVAAAQEMIAWLKTKL